MAERSVERRISELTYLSEFGRTISDAKSELKDQTAHVVGHLAKIWTFPDHPNPDWYVHMAAAPRRAPRYRTNKPKAMTKGAIASTMYGYATGGDGTLYTMMKDEVDTVTGCRACHDYADPEDREAFKKVLHDFLDRYAARLCEKSKAGKDIDGDDIKDIVNDMRENGKW